MNKLPKLFLSLLFLTAVLVFPSSAHAAVRVYFDPTHTSVAQNNEFTVTVKIDAESNQVVGSDAVVSYAAADLDVTAVTTGGYFPEFTNANDAAAGRLEIHGYVTSTYQSKTGAGTLATIKFKVKKGSGSSSITLTCSGSGNDTNVLDISGQNILSCPQVNAVAITYTGASITNTPTPTQPPGDSGNTVPTCTSLTSNITTATGTPQAVTFTCSGVDPGGIITGYEFTFGDGTKDLVSSPMTTHTYTTIGTLGATCRVRDNANAYSGATDSCKRIVTIRPRTNTVATTSTNTSTSVSTVTKTPTPTPTTAVVALISETPYPTYAPIGTTEPLYAADEEISSDRTWWIIGGAVAVLLAYLLLRRKKKIPPPIPPMPPIIVQEMPPAQPQYPSASAAQAPQRTEMNEPHG